MKSLKEFHMRTDAFVRGYSEVSGDVNLQRLPGGMCNVWLPVRSVSIHPPGWGRRFCMAPVTFVCFI